MSGYVVPDGLRIRIEQAIARGDTEAQIVRRELVSRNIIRKVRQHMEWINELEDSTHPQRARESR